MRPSEAGLEVVLTEASLWYEYVIPLGLTIDQVKFLNQQIQQPGLRGLLALNHWKKGHCGDSYPTTWGHLLDAIAQCPEYGPTVANELKEKLAADSVCELSEVKVSIQKLIYIISINKYLQNTICYVVYFKNPVHATDYQFWYSHSICMVVLNLLNVN